MLKTLSQVQEKESIRWSKWNLTGCDKNFDSLVLRATIGKELVVRSPKLLVQNVLNNNKETMKTCIKCVLCSIKSRGRRTEITPNGPGYQAFHGCYIQKERMASKRWNLLDCSAFFYYLRTIIFSWMDKFISCQRLVPVFTCFIICGQREMCLFLGQVVSKIYASESNFYLPRTIGQKFCRALFNIISFA